MGKLGRKGGAFPQSGAAEPHGVHSFPLIWTALGRPRRKRKSKGKVQKAKVKSEKPSGHPSLLRELPLWWTLSAT